MNVEDKAGEAYWSSFWNQLSMPDPVDLNDPSLKSYEFRKWHKIFDKAFSHLDKPNSKVLELGCGNSVFLSYFNKQFGLDVWGLDYSEFGCNQTKRILDRDGVNGHIVQGDIFNPPAELIGQFDVVCSFGVLEHFEDSTATLVAFAKFLKPGGTLITSVPYLKGAVGLLQKAMNKPVYDIHILMNREEVKSYLINANLDVKYCEYHVPISFGVTLEKHENTPVKNLFIKRYFLKSLQVISKVFWWIDDKLFELPTLPFFTAGIVTVATKKS